ncbi:hypothetical protein [Streptomyces sp. NPDC058086]|uniref:hypothetical protein n=1 Tax=Streptomyces sp. NPDC058086 TaxID=3346334 RepID=UPI0036EE6734
MLLEVTDSHGRLVPDATLEVTFRADDAGELATVAAYRRGQRHQRRAHRRSFGGLSLRGVAALSPNPREIVRDR